MSITTPTEPLVTPSTPEPSLPPTPIRSVFSGPDDDWQAYTVELSFTGKLYGGSPFDPNLVEGWLKSTLGVKDEVELAKWMEKHLREIQGIDPTEPQISDEALEKAVADNAIEQKAQGFKRTLDQKPYVEGRHIKAMIKEATNIAFPQGEHKWGRYRNTKGTEVGGKSPVSYVAERVWVPEVPVVVGEPLNTSPREFEFAVGHIEDYRGRRSTIGYFEYVTAPVLHFRVEVLDDCVTGEQWARIMQTAERNGLGARRSQGGGQFLTTAWAKE